MDLFGFHLFSVDVLLLQDLSQVPLCCRLPCVCAASQLALVPSTSMAWLGTGQVLVGKPIVGLLMLSWD